MVHLNKRNITTLFLLIIWMVACYMLPNKILLRPPTSVPNTPIDQYVLFSPNWIWIYISYYIFIFGTYLVLNDEKSKHVLVEAYSKSGLAACLIFFIFPTTISRDPMPSIDAYPFSGWAFNIIRNADSNLNCLPSMHISLSVIATMILWNESRKMGLWAAFWTLLISYSTMATKQHYFLDVTTGALFGFVFWYLEHKKNSNSYKVSSFFMKPVK